MHLDAVRVGHVSRHFLSLLPQLLLQLRQRREPVVLLLQLRQAGQLLLLATQGLQARGAAP